MLDLRNADPAVINKRFGVVVQRTVYELGGISCIELGAGDLLDKVHRRHGETAIGLGLAGVRLGPGFEMRREMLSPRCTTH
ncbi:DUF4113 domain-containing protein [Leifsonia aquatica]|uniref:DUF4113 domain-containing protein n=1 Tax=Leifsonia aquatica TaxID=144185 RepID=UPI0037FC8DA0